MVLYKATFRGFRFRSAGGKSTVMDVFSAVVVILAVFVTAYCNAQVKNSSLPLVMWHGMGNVLSFLCPAEVRPLSHWKLISKFMLICSFRKKNFGAREYQRPLLECIGRFTATSLKLLSK